MRVQWQYLKSFANAKMMSVQWIENTNEYYLYVYDGPVMFECILDKNPTDNTDLLDFETNYKTYGNKPVFNQRQAFDSKQLSNGKKLWRRVHGVSATVSGAADNIDFVVPYNNCKITGIEVIGAELGDCVNVKFYDTPTGTISGIPDYLLNQAGFTVYLAKDFHREHSSYDADLIKDMKLRVEYDAVNSDLLPKTIYINFILHELK